MNLFEYLNARAIRNANVDTIIGRTQRSLSYQYLFVFAATLACLFFLPKPIDEIVKTLLLMMLGALITLLTQQNSFWYGRPRGAGIPDPSLTETKTTETKTTETKTAPILPIIPAEPGPTPAKPIGD